MTVPPQELELTTQHVPKPHKKKTINWKLSVRYLSCNRPINCLIYQIKVQKKLKGLHFLNISFPYLERSSQKQILQLQNILTERVELILPCWSY